MISDIVSKVEQLIKMILPMKHFTPESFKPREQTLDIIRQFAYTYRPVSNPQARKYSLN